MSADLQQEAIDRLQAASHEVTVVRLLVDHPGRCTFEAVVDGRRCAVKAEPERAIAAREASATRWAHAGGLGAPEVLFTDDDADVAVIVVEWIDGLSLADSSDAGDWVATGTAIRALHDAQPPDHAIAFSEGEPWWEFFERWASRECAEAIGYEVIDAAVAGRVETRLLDWLRDRPEPSMAFMHGDLQPAHVVVAPGRVSLIDWGDASLGDPVWDLAVLLLDHPEREVDVLSGYGRSDEFAERVGAYRLLRHLGAINWLVEYGFDPASSVHGLMRQLEP